MHGFWPYDSILFVFDAVEKRYVMSCLVLSSQNAVSFTAIFVLYYNRLLCSRTLTQSHINTLFLFVTANVVCALFAPHTRRRRRLIFQYHFFSTEHTHVFFFLLLYYLTKCHISFRMEGNKINMKKATNNNNNNKNIMNMLYIIYDSMPNSENANTHLQCKNNIRETKKGKKRSFISQTKAITSNTYLI